jgi:hypothetical protein
LENIAKNMPPKSRMTPKIVKTVEWELAPATQDPNPNIIRRIAPSQEMNMSAVLLRIHPTITPPYLLTAATPAVRSTSSSPQSLANRLSLCL